MSSIINLQNYTDALRNTGYKNVESAIAEIVDNSLEAEANDVLIICTQGDSSRFIDEVAILDNGFGMEEEILSKCLVIGDSTKRERKGMGRFGVGLPQASLHVCPRVEVYSWTKKGVVNCVYLDIAEIKAGKQQIIEVIKDASIPKKYQKYISKKYVFNEKEMTFENSGTLVVWKQCDRLKPKSIAPLFERFKILLGRKFRHFVHDDKHSIGMTVSNSTMYDEFLKPNDPLCLMRDNVILGRRDDPKHAFTEGEPIFEFWENGDVCGITKLKVPFYDKDGVLKNSIVEVTFSWAKPEFHIAGGESEIGQYIKKNVGVSVVRAGREIDFGKFDFFSDVNEPQHRWWGCEIKFNPELDEVFGVANNKQQVELFELLEEEYSDEEVKPVWFQLNSLISREIKQIFNALKARKKGSRSESKNKNTEESIVSSVEESNTTLTASKAAKEESNEQQLKDLVRERLMEAGTPDPTEEEIKDAMSPPVKLDFRDLGDNSMFIDINNRMGNCWLTINKGSVFYRDLYSKIEEQDESVRRAFNLILMAFARAEDEAFSNKQLFNAFSEVREEWGRKLKKYLNTDYQA